MDAVIITLVVVVLAAAVRVEAQFAQRGFGRGFLNVRVAKAEDFDGRFNFCRVMFDSDFRGDGANWSVDYPRADINLSIRLAELTKTTISRDSSGNPKHLLVRLTDPELFGCPFIMMTEVGSASFSAERRHSFGHTWTRAGSCGPTTSGGLTRGTGGWPSFGKRSPPTSTPSSTSRRPTQCSALCSM
jgi:hypothetical protein